MGRRSLHEEITGEIRQLLLRGELKPGEKIPEQALAAKLEVSRTPLREALKALSVEGLVTLLPNRGAIVAEVTRTQIEELIPIMAMLEEYAGKLLCQALRKASSPARIMDHLEELHAGIVEGHHQRDTFRYRSCNKQFHEAVIQHGGNGSLLEVYNITLARMHMGRFLTEKSEEEWQTAVEDHEDIMTAIRARDGRRTGQLLKHHAQHTAKSAVLNALERATV
ncbi:GntR family transcriptional regulator [Salipiger aestuarii]|uniref:DNA-binding GntR family transcriptional regulator n=1 Tax=Salipiger aestuarii TaxID=568098 RepID=A0A327XP23_9RHOB|nr:GntR family transcriptional regulator [Salipiger aestuarii]RAK09005.1 DNA-binding GntR family transcriptional regulator [Salipiger aestuarii]